MRGELPLDIERILQHFADLAYAGGSVPAAELDKLAADLNHNRAMWQGIAPDAVEAAARYYGVPAPDAAAVADLVRRGQAGPLPVLNTQLGGFSHCACD